VFVGVTVMDKEPVTGGVRVTATGDGGIVQARVLVASPLAAGTAVGQAADGTVNDYLVANPGLVVGTLVDDFSTLTGAALGQVYFCRVQVGAASAPGDIQTFQISALNAGRDYYTARTWDGAVTGTVDFLIAKTYDFRPSSLNETVDGVALVHAFTDDNHRTTDDGTNPVQNEVCWPRFAVGNEVQAELCANGTPVKDASGNVIPWIDATKRVWIATN
jgi:hypothetical protein